MLCKTIEFDDFNGVHRKEDHYFHMSKAEVIKFLTTTGDYTLDKVVLRLTKERNGKKIMEIFEDLIHMSYGVKSDDGRRFIKNDEVWNAFHESNAYNELFLEIVTDAKKAANFMNAIIPEDLAAEVSKIMKDHPDGIPVELKDYVTD